MRRIVAASLAWIVLFAGPFGASALAQKQENPEAVRLKERSLDHWIDRSHRLQRIAQRLQLAGSQICGEAVSPILGAAVVDLEEGVFDVLKPVARTRFRGGHRFYVTGIFEGMAAERAGLQVGDAILKLNTVVLKSESDFYGFEHRGGSPNVVEVSRDGEVKTIEVESEYGCRFPASIEVREVANAGANRESITVALGFLRLIDDDAVLASIIGHEIAHAIYWRLNGERRSGWVSRRNEARADYVGTYLAAIAGYPLVNYFDEGSSLSFNLELYSARTTHPAGPARMSAMRKTIEEIADKIRRGERLEPNFE